MAQSSIEATINQDNVDFEGIEDLTEQDMTEIKQKPEGAADIQEPDLDPELLKQLKSMLDNSTPEELKSILGSLYGNETQRINPGQKKFSSTNKRAMLKEKLRQRVAERQVGRLNKTERQKYIDAYTKQEEESKKRQELNKVMQQLALNRDQKLKELAGQPQVDTELVDQCDCSDHNHNHNKTQTPDLVA
jgi:hypothetical protein